MNMAVCVDQNLSLSKRFDKLVSLSIMDCERCEKLPALGKLTSLKYLTLCGLSNIGCIEPSFYGNDNMGCGEHNKQMPKIAFPALKTSPAENYMEFRRMDGSRDISHRGCRNFSQP